MLPEFAMLPTVGNSIVLGNTDPTHVSKSEGV